MIIKRSLIILNIVVIVLFVWMGQKQHGFEMNNDGPTLPLVGYLAPSFSLESFDGEQISYDNDLLALGKPILINFWASWCPPCKAEMPDLVEVAEAFEHEVTFIGINVAIQDSMSQSKEFLARYHVQYMNLIDPNGDVSRLYQVPPIPTTLVIDKDGTVVYRKLGGMTKSEMIAAIQRGVEGGEKNAQ